jgi:PTH1 family peptidyl-tRNA hydrolase
MKAIVGLGNPGRQYAGTRHNVGFEVIDALARRWALPSFTTWHDWADIAFWRPPDLEPVVLARPLTFMNASGEAVGELARYYKIDPADVLVIVDEVQLAVGRIRARASGSAGGHNGLKSVIQHLGTGFPRLRIGVGRGDPRWDLADHVLSKFTRDEREAIGVQIDRAADAAETFAREGIAQTMNQFNVRGDRAVDDNPQ